MWKRSQPRTIHSFAIVAVCSLEVFSWIPAAKAAYLPLVLGRSWAYRSAGGSFERTRVTDVRELWGHTVYVIKVEEGDQNRGLENYWSTAETGEVQLWGFWREIEGFGYLYSPPVTMLAPPLYVGKRWESIFNIFALPDTTFVRVGSAAMMVEEQGDIEVPAGVFFCFGVGLAAPRTDVPPYLDLMGRRVDDDSREGANKWWSDEVGVVQYLTDDLYELESYDAPVAAKRTTWSELKALFAQ